MLCLLNVWNHESLSPPRRDPKRCVLKNLKLKFSLHLPDLDKISERRGKLKMKKETRHSVYCGCLSLRIQSPGATVAILRGTRGAEKTAMVQKPPMAPSVAPESAPQALIRWSVASKIQALKDIVKKDLKIFRPGFEMGNLYFELPSTDGSIEALHTVSCHYQPR